MARIAFTFVTRRMVPLLESLSTDVFEPRTSTAIRNISSSTRNTPFFVENVKL